MYKNGKGILTDYIQAYAWWNIAKASGSLYAPRNLDLIVKKMTANQIAEGQKLSIEILDRITKNNKS